jgi:hypothetical protein
MMVYSGGDVMEFWQVRGGLEGWGFEYVSCECVVNDEAV